MMKKTIAILLALLLVAALFAGCGAKSEGSSAETVSFTVVYEDGTSEEFELSCENETLSDALAAAGLVTQDEADAGYVTTVNDVFADYDADEAWWRLVDGEGKDALVGISDIDTAEADGYSFVYTIGF